MKQSYLIAFWSPFPLRDLCFCTDFFSPLLKKYGDIQCLDCQNRYDRRTLSLLRQADLVIIGLPQKKRLLDSYFCYEFRQFPNTVYLIMDYFPRESIPAEDICLDYRIPPERLARIPYNIRFRDAARRGKSVPYLAYQHSRFSYEDYIGFRHELLRSARLFLSALGTI